ncbi:pyridoxal phosphate-dependent transferase [Hyaloraphidium curvatum]|nr:pyridoxal phosphate-dependent transferase [Hyaloraphidium curvatum]
MRSPLRSTSALRIALLPPLSPRHPALLPRSALSARAMSSTAPPPPLSDTEAAKPQPISSYARYITARSAARQPSAIRALQPFLSIPGMISLGGGMPNPAMFPFESMSVKLKDGTVLDVPAEEMAKGLQYSATAGLPDLVAFLRTLQDAQHRPPVPYDICVTNGSQEAFTKAFDMLIEPGDHILVDSPGYSGAFACLRPLFPKFVEVPTDADGLDPAALERILASYRDSPQRPKFLYTVPTGANPSGLCTSPDRRRRIYHLARKYGLLILEDDPYYFLQFRERLPSYLSMDEDGRVLRFDSMSKVLSAGVRIGWATGPQQLIERIVLHGQAMNLHPSGPSQLLVASLVGKWKLEGFLEHVGRVEAFYVARRDAFLRAADKHLKRLATWNVPRAGMFVWIKVDGVAEAGSLVKAMVDKKVLMVPGFEFYPSPPEGGCPYVRAAYSTATEEQMDEALRRLAEVIREARAGKS